ncbi:MAG TPA: endonuclease V, partial [Anaerolineales bacterium]|nr:endonuclease V [Anaerolineales bacterium]
MPLMLHHAHPWDLSPGEARLLQDRLRDKVILQPLELGEIKTVAGVDAGYRGGQARAAVVVLGFKTQELREQAAVQMLISYPYVPGLLSFREAPAILEALARLSALPDVLIVDGHGLAHPRRFGLACHLGVLLDLPTFGCAKSVLVGRAAPPGGEVGSTSELS